MRDYLQLNRVWIRSTSSELLSSNETEAQPKRGGLKCRGSLQKLYRRRFGTLKRSIASFSARHMFSKSAI